MPKMRLVMDNAADRATITASSTAGLLTVANLKKPYKTLVHRAAGTSVTYTLTWPSPQRISMVAFPMCNFSENATVEVGTWPAGFDNTTVPPTPIFATTGPVQAAQGQASAAWGFDATAGGGVNSFPYGGGAYAAVWFYPQTLSQITVTVNDPGNAAGYVEAAYIVAGDAWTPVYDPVYGASVTAMDDSKNERSDAGDLLTSRSFRYRKLSLPLSFVDPSDREKLWNFLRMHGTSRPFYVSLFPDDDDKNREQAHQLYGKLSTVAALVVASCTTYSTSLEVEEV